MAQKTVPVVDTTNRADAKVIAWDATNSTHEYVDQSGGASLASAAYTRTAGDYTTTSTSFVDVDATNLSLAITTGAHRVMIGLVADCENNTNLASVYLDVTVDGTRLGGTNGIHRQVHTNGTIPNSASFVWLTEALSAASHTFKLQWKVGSGTGKLYGNSTNTQLRFWVAEFAG